MFVINLFITDKVGKITTQQQVGQPVESLKTARETLFGSIPTIKHLMADSARINYKEEYFSVDKQENMNILTIVMDNNKKTYKKAVFTIVPID